MMMRFKVVASQGGTLCEIDDRGQAIVAAKAAVATGKASCVHVFERILTVQARVPYEETEG